jgi:hypothetical protein
MTDFCILTKNQFSLTLNILKMKKVILLISVVIIICSCNKNDEPTNVEVTKSSYLPMAVGNYWVYQEYFERGDGTFFIQNIMDSTCISKDTLINGRPFYKFVNYQIIKSLNNPVRLEATYFYADSAKHLINPKGEILFSEDNFSDILYKTSDVLEGDTATWLTFKMEKLNQAVNVPAGSFTDILNVKGTVICSPNFTNIPNPRYVNKYFAKNVGKVLHSYIWVQGGGGIERRLLRYSIKE